MSDDSSSQITGKISIETADAKAQLDQIKAPLQQTKEKLQEITQVSQQSTQQIQNSFKEMGSQVTNAVKDMHGQVTSAFDSVTGTITKISSAFLAVGAILAGGALFKGVVDEYVKLNSEAKQLSTVMGTSVEEAGYFAGAFEHIGINGEALNSMMMRMARQLKTNEDGFNANNIATRDASGNMLSMEQITMNVISRMQEMKGGYDTVAISQLAFGRGAGDVNALLKITPQLLEHIKERYQSLGLTLDDLSAAKAKAFKEGMKDVGLVFTALQYQIGKEMVPALITLGHMFADVGPPIIHAFATAVNAVQNFLMNATVAASNVRVAFEGTWDALSKGAAAVKQRLMETCGTDVVGSFAAGMAAMKNSLKDWHDQAIRDANEVRFAIMSAQPGLGSDENLGGFPGAPKKSASSGPKGGAEFVNKDKGGKGGGGGSDSIVQQWQAELDQLKAADKRFQDQSVDTLKDFWQVHLDTGKTATKEELANLKAQAEQQKVIAAQAEREFWSEKLTQTQEGSKEYQEVFKKVLTADQNINKLRLQSEIEMIQGKIAANQDSVKDQVALLDNQQKLDKIDLEAKKENIRYLSQLGSLSKAQELKDYRQLLQQEQQADLQREQQKLILYQGDQQKYREQLLKLGLLKKQQVLDMEKADNQISLAEQSTWQGIFNSVKQGFGSLFQSITSGTQDFGKTITGVFTQVGNSIGNIFLEMGMKYVESLVFQKAAGSELANSRIDDSSAEAGAAAVASVFDALPFPENLMVAPAAGAAAAAMAGAFSIEASAAGGFWEVPRMLTTVLHPQEMVLPAWAAEGVRNIIQGQGASENGGGGNQVTVNFHVNAVDARGMEDVLRRNSRALVRAINQEIGTRGQKIGDGLY